MAKRKEEKMTLRTAIFCDLCGAEIRGNKDHYKFCLESGKYTDAAGDIDTDIVEFDFCRKCANRFVDKINNFVQLRRGEET